MTQILFHQLHELIDRNNTHIVIQSINDGFDTLLVLCPAMYKYKSISVGTMWIGRAAIDLRNDSRFFNSVRANVYALP